MFKSKIVIASGGFDPIHKGHIEYLKKAKDLGDYLIVILNTDVFLKKKKGYCFMDFENRQSVLNAIKYVDEIIVQIDDDMSVCKTIEKIKNKYPNNELIFAKGGDRTKDNILEKDICEKLNIKIIDGLGDKIESSSDFTINLMKKVIR